MSGLDEPGDYLVRRLRPEEWRELRALRLRALADAPDAFGSTLVEAEAEPDADWQQQANAEDGVVIVADVGGRLVGMVLGGRAPFGEQIALLRSMWVEPAVRGTGVAAAMVGAIVEWAREAGYRSVGLGVTTSNARAIALYARLGFSDIGQRFRPPSRTDLEMQVMVLTLVEER